MKKWTYVYHYQIFKNSSYSIQRFYLKNIKLNETFLVYLKLILNLIYEKCDLVIHVYEQFFMYIIALKRNTSTFQSVTLQSGYKTDNLATPIVASYSNS